MTSTCSASATALPASPALFDTLPRRGFLRQLASLPLIGGGVSIIGSPRGVAEPVTENLMQAYKTWLHYEHRLLSREISELPELVAYYGDRRRSFNAIEPLISFVDIGEARNYHFPSAGHRPSPSTRAALVLSAVGCDWRSRRED
jgi:hypothetical protein